MRIVAYLVIHDEIDRYLQACLLRLREQVDAIYVLDDGSDHIGTGSGYIHAWGATVFERRPDHVSPFLKRENECRGYAWQRMVETLDVQDGDWVVALDADEFLVGESPRSIAHEAELRNYQTVRFFRPEIYKLDPPTERFDGFWGGIANARMTKYRAGDQSFRDVGMACGSLPEYAENQRTWMEFLNNSSHILHYGYANVRDREEKYFRYTSLEHNHSSTHIQSILEPPQLRSWTGETPEVWRGIKLTSLS